MSVEFRFDNHVTEERLIRLLDGELDKRQKEVVMRHLESCWACRRRREQFQESMDRFVEFEEALINTPSAAPPREWNGFRSKLREVAECGATRREHAWVSALRAGALAPVVLAVTALVALWLAPTRSVSAKEIIERSASSEEAVLTGSGNPLVVQRLRVESADHSGLCSVWRAPSAGRFRQNWDSADGLRLGAEMEQLYANHGLDSRRPLSAANYSQWRGSLALRKDSVRQEGGLLRILTRDEGQFHAGRIVEAQLLVRASDWHPIEESFTVFEPEAERRYRIVEIGFTVEPLNAESARIFEPTGPPEVRPPSSRPDNALETPELAASAVETPAPSLAESEVEALALLHEIDADRQEAAQVERGARTIRVTAYALIAERKALIEQRLAAVPSVESAVYLLSESAFSNSAKTAPDPAPTGASRSLPPLFLSTLAEKTGSSMAANLLVSRQMDLLRGLAVELSAVERLAHRFPRDDRDALSVAGLDRLDALALDHVASARRLWAEMDPYAGLLLGAIGASSPLEAGIIESKSCGAWYERRAPVADTAWRLEELLARSFTTVAGEPMNDISEESVRTEAPLLRASLARTLATGCLY
jgi:hypothetical protein